MMEERADNTFKHDERIEKIYAQILRYTTSDFNERGQISDKGDELDAITVGLNTLGEELQASGRAVKQFNERITGLMEVLLRYTLMDFSAKAEISESGDELDAIAVGLNTMAEELKVAQESETFSREQLEAKAVELETVNKELEAFTYSVSHDLRSPLRAIHGYTKIILDEYTAKFDESGADMMLSVMRNAKKMGQLIDDLLAFSRTGRKELMKKEIDMKQLASSIMEELKTTLPPFNAKVNILELPPAHADYSLMSQVFVNLISNAIKYSSTKPAPEVTIGATERKDGTVYYIADNGVGFDMQYYDKLFGVFQRLHSAEEFEGTGVGLALIKRIITRHGGKIWAEAKPGEGATFYFTLK
jgi:light-regulated signal transduction histidine kinase (bacteriophytochrome)